jgi:gas vesicle protein
MAQDNGGNFIWFISGLVLGGAAGLLLAPETGSATRKRLTKRAKLGSKSIAESSREAYEKGRDLYERGRELAEDAAEMFERGRKLAEKKLDDLV